MLEREFTEIQILNVAEREHPTRGKWHKIYCKDLRTNESKWYNCWDKKVKPIKDKLYFAAISITRNDNHDKYYTINELFECKKTDNGYCEVKEDIGTKEPKEKPKEQKSYSELQDENQTESLLLMVSNELKTLTDKIESLSAFVYSEHYKEIKK